MVRHIHIVEHNLIFGVNTACTEFTSDALRQVNSISFAYSQGVGPRSHNSTKEACPSTPMKWYLSFVEWAPPDCHA